MHFFQIGKKSHTWIGVSSTSFSMSMRITVQSSRPSPTAAQPGPERRSVHIIGAVVSGRRGRVHGDVGGDAGALPRVAVVPPRAMVTVVPFGNGGNWSERRGSHHLGPPWPLKHTVRTGRKECGRPTRPQVRRQGRTEFRPSSWNNGDAGGWGGGGDGLTGQGGGAGTQQAAARGDSQGALGSVCMIPFLLSFYR